MAYFKVWLDETLHHRLLVVEANSAEEAIEKYQEAWENGQIDVVDSHVEADCSEIPEPEGWYDLLNEWLAEADPQTQLTN